MSWESEANRREKVSRPIYLSRSCFHVGFERQPQQSDRFRERIRPANAETIDNWGDREDGAGKNRKGIRPRLYDSDLGFSADPLIRIRKGRIPPPLPPALFKARTIHPSPLVSSGFLRIYNLIIDVMSSERGGVAAGEGQRELHVLAVDDSSVDRALVAHLLRSSKFRVTTVDSGKRALDLLGMERNVSLIITDYWMPEMTGLELLKKIKGSSEFKAIPVVIMSSENVPNRIRTCLDEGAEDFLLKPLQPSDVSRLCSRVLR